MLIEVLAFIPFVVLFILMVVFKIPAIKSVPASLIVLFLISLIVWRIPSAIFGVSAIRGTFLALEIMLIVFGAIFLISVLKNTGQLSSINGFLSSINSDARIQVIILAWLFGSLIEGVAGFGTPAAIVAPLLYSIGFPSILSVVAPLIADSLSVSFGAVGVPITLGIGSLGFSAEILKQTTIFTALIHSLAGIVVPLSLVYLTVLESKAKEKRKAFFEAVPFALFTWAVFVSIYLATAYFVGPELPAITASLGSLAICGFAARKNFLQPKSDICFAHEHKKIKNSKKKILLALSPYIAIILFLLFSRIIPSFKNYLTTITIGITNILSTGNGYSFAPFYTPAFIFIVSALLFSFILKEQDKIPASSREAFIKLRKPTIALIFTLIFVQILILSGTNSSGFPAFPTIIANTIISLFGKFYVFFSPFVGAMGSFIAGSNTVSNLLFGTLQSEAALSIGASIALLLALQVVGGGIGNTFAIHNVLAAQATVHLNNKEGIIIRKILLIATIYGILAGLIGFGLFYLLQ